MKVAILIFLVAIQFLDLCNSIAIKPEIKHNSLNAKSDEAFVNRDYVRRKRYLGLSRKFKLNKRYQECIGPGDAAGHCKHISYCPARIFQKINTLDYLCVIEERFVGVCCPDDITSSAVSGSQLIIDLPAGGEDYDETDQYTGCGLSSASSIATKQARQGELPWIAALMPKDKDELGVQQHICGGALITDSHILTASHCTYTITAEDIFVRLGEYDFNRADESRFRDYDVAEIIQHPNFVVATYENDIAILKLKTAISFNTYMWPICLPPAKRDFVNETVIVAGWGRLSFGGSISEVLNQVAIPVWPLETCIDAFAQKITDDNICAAAYEGGKDSCQGDSGGPLMYQLENGRWITIGVVSWGIGCGNKGSPGIYTRVGNYLPWIIKNTMAKND
ncbi:trypsin-1-like [Diorhabda sublineata]|uniref:trypsin-1-like n=1 Tax=Diorhabda sublineata TaxID=1163346 RepID=UPI0024E0C7E7|nr:trypsin-1-like [Diorhabda sublineata]